jgi:polysaccharide export outer membrane protein
LHPGDSIYVSHTPRYYLALGALGPGAYLGLINRRLTFDDTRITLADALAKVGGLEDDRANTRAVFLYRTEDRATLAKLGSVPDTMPEKMPTIYVLDLSEAAGYFYAQRMMMRNEDLLFVSNAPATDLTKFLNLVVPIAQSFYNFRQ